LLLITYIVYLVCQNENWLAVDRFIYCHRPPNNQAYYFGPPSIFELFVKSDSRLLNTICHVLLLFYKSPEFFE